MGIRRKSREIVIQTLYALSYAEVDEYLQHLDYVNKYKEILDDLAVENEIESDNSIYIQAENTIQNIIPKFDELDKILNNYLGDYSFEKIGLLDLMIIRLAIYEMIFDKTPPAVMINEAIELAKRFCAEKSPSVINAILDAIKVKELNSNEQ